MEDKKMHQCLIRYTFIVSILLLAPSIALTASMQLNYSNELPSTDSYSLSKSVSTPLTRNENWETNHEQEILILPFDGLNIPIVYSNEYVYASPEYGYFVFNSQEIRALTTTPLVSAPVQVNQTTFKRRPTLYVTLCGANSGDANILEGSQLCSWSFTFGSQLADYYESIEATPSMHQHHHMMVDWDGLATNVTQAKDLSGRIKSFLSAKNNKWDVVLIGHSRGGILAHELSRKLVGSNKIDNIHTILLDPTATPVLADRYPSELANASGTQEYGSLFYDNQPFVFILGVAIDTTTYGDKPILGYDNYGRYDHIIFNSSHNGITADWLNGASPWGFSRAMSDIISKKTPGTFVLDGNKIADTTLERISRANDIEFVGDIVIENDTLFIHGYLTFGGTYGTTAGFSAEVGKNGVELFSSFAVATSHLILRENHLYYSTNISIANAAASLSKEGLYLTYGASMFSNSISLTEDRFTVAIQVLGWDQDLKINTEDLVTLGIVSAGSKVKKEIKRVLNKIKIRW